MTIKATIVRGKSTGDGTPGRLTLENGWSCDTLELPWEDNQRGVSCTIADVYKAVLRESQHLGSPHHKLVDSNDGGKLDVFRRVYRLEDKNGRQNCEIHSANFAGEVRLGEETQLHGCTAVGFGYGMLMNHNDVMQKAILNSIEALEALIERTKGEDLEVTYIWAPGCAPADLNQ